MSIVAWMILGLATGVLACSGAKQAGAGFLPTVALAVSGSVAFGALLYRYCEDVSVTAQNGWSLFLSMVFGVVLLAAQAAAVRLRTDRR